MRYGWLAAAATGATAAGVVAWTGIGADRDDDRDGPRDAPGERFEHPRPTEVPDDQEEGEDADRGREEWVERIHRVPPGVEWRSIEAGNVRALIADRNLLRGRRAAPIGEWVERGSDNLAGSIYTVRRSVDGTKLVAGASSGGIWRSTDADGADWEPHGDNVFGGAHELVLLPGASASDPDVMLVAPTYTNLVYRSDDDGGTWTAPTGLPADLVTVRRIVVATDGTVWLVGADNSGSTLYKSTDAGLSFTAAHDLGGGWGDVWVPRVGDATVYALAQTHLLVSDDGGASWDTRPGASTVSVGRIAGSEATNPPTLYVVPAGYYGSSGAVDVYRSDDLGTQWDARAPMSDYWDVIAASIRDPDLVVYGGVDLHVSKNGAQSYRSPNTWDEYYGDIEHKLHADMMAMTVAADGPAGESWYVGCHGGVYRSTDGFDHVSNLSLHGLRVGQYYSVHTSLTDPKSIVVGAQDQGEQVTTTAPAIGDERFDFDQAESGDYGHLVSTDGTHDSWVFSVYPGFLMALKTTGEEEFAYFPPDNALPPWLPFLAPDPKGKDDAVLFGAGKLWRYQRSDYGYWDPTPLSSQNFDQSGGEYVSAVAFSPLEKDLGWVMTSVGRVFRSTDRGVTWSNVTGSGPEGSYLYGSTVMPSHLDAGRVLFAGSGYDGPSVWLSTDEGKSLTPWDQGLPPTMVYTLTELHDGTGRVVAGTENTVYVRAPDDPKWVEAVGTAAPIVEYFSSEPLYTENTVRFATYGRGLWDFRLDPQGEGCFAIEDADHDGVLCELDCDDQSAEVFPGAPDTCDGVDSDCDGVAERDKDGDGSFDCDDCDDHEALAFPGNPEVECDGIDNDCDGQEVCPETTQSTPKDGTDVAEGNCGCAEPSGSGSWLGLVALATLVRGRRRVA